jgi:hypothetical protein
LPVADEDALALRQEMWITREAFLRNLPAAVGDAPFDIAGNEIRHDGPERSWRIVLTPLPDRSIGELTLARHVVEIFLAGFDARSTAKFLDRFELHYRRGGG